MTNNLHREPLIVAQGLTKTFGSQRAVGDVSFRIERGESVGLLGENGAGKTTTFRLLSGSLAPSSGTVQIGPYGMASEATRAKRLIGYMPEALVPYPELTAEEYLTFRAQLSGRVESKQVHDEVHRVQKLTQIEPGARKPLATRSKGYRQRVLLSAALLGDPAVILLDEPTSGLDPSQVLEFRALIAELARDHTIVLSTHVLSEVEATCSRVLILHQGALAVDDSIARLKEGSNGRPLDEVFRALVRPNGAVEAAQADARSEAATRSEGET